MKTVKRILIISIPVVVVAALVAGFSLPHINKISQIKNTVVVEVNDQSIVAEVADDTEEREQGLSNKDSIWVNGGMLFLFDIRSEHYFWMKDMNFPIDIVWIDGNEIVGIDKNVQPEPGVSRDNLTLYSPPDPVDKVLELQAGRADILSAEEGDVVEFKSIASDELEQKLEIR